MIELRDRAWSAVRVSGGDRISFLQGQLTQDIENQTTRWSLVLQPDGAVLVGVFIQRNADSIDLVVPSECAEPLVARLRRFLLRVDVALEHIVQVDAPFTLAGQVESGWPDAPEWALGLPPHSFGRPIVDESISFQKGCFTGQELVGRADARGASMPWRYVRGTGGSLEALDEALAAVGPEGPQGLTSWALIDGVIHWRGFAHRTMEVDLVVTNLGGELRFMA